MTGDDEARLLRKYETLAQLRAEGADAASRERLQPLAAEFPGALRQLDQLRPEELERRVRILRTGGASGDTHPPLWARVEVTYHRTLRACLAVRRRAVTQSSGAGLEHWIESEMDADGHEPSARWLLDHLMHIQHPPQGRLNGWVLQQVADRFGLTPEAVTALMFPVPTCGRDPNRRD